MLILALARSIIRAMEKNVCPHSTRQESILIGFHQSGVTFHEAQVAMARIWIGKDSHENQQEVVTLERPQDETGDPNQTGEKQKVSEGVKMPKTVDEVRGHA